MNDHYQPRINVNCRQVDAYDYVCYPACQLSYLACSLVEQDYLTVRQLKILELMGFKIETTKQDLETLDEDI